MSDDVRDQRRERPSNDPPRERVDRRRTASPDDVVGAREASLTDDFVAADGVIAMIVVVGVSVGVSQARHRHVCCEATHVRAAEVDAASTTNAGTEP